MSDDAPSPDVQEIVTTLQRLCLNVQRNDALYEQTRDEMTAEDVSKWFNIEVDESIQIGIVEDAMTS